MLQVNKVSKRTEYRGELFDMVRAIVEVPCGGQILLDGPSFAGALTADAVSTVHWLCRSSFVCCWLTAGLRSISVQVQV